MRGLSEAKGSWKTIWMRERSGRMALRSLVWIGFAVEEDLAALIADEADEGLPEGGLARAGFADETERLVPLQLEVEVVDGDELEEVRLEQAAALQRERRLDLPALEDRRVRPSSSGPARPLGLGCQQVLGVGCCGLANSASVGCAPAPAPFCIT